MVRIDCLLTFIYCFLHRCEALRQRVLYVSQLHVHNNVITLKYQTEPATFKVMYANSSFRRTEKRKPKRLVIFGELRKDNRANDLLKAQEGSKDKGWQNSWSNYSQAVFFLSVGERICELVIILNLLARSCGMMGDRWGRLINRMGLVKSNQGLCSWHFQAWLFPASQYIFIFCHNKLQ